MAESFFKRLSNDVLEATEQVANRMEEGLALLFNGGEPDRSNAGQIPAPTDNNPFQGADDDHDQENLEEEFRNHPLQGIADSVVGDILSGQVGTLDGECRHASKILACLPFSQSVHIVQLTVV